MKNIILLLILSLASNSIFSQDCKQDYPSVVFSTKTFIDFINDSDDGEEILLDNNYCYYKTTKPGKLTYFFYKIESYDEEESEYYEWESYILTNGSKQMKYTTTSIKKYLHYKRKLIDYGFKNTGSNKYRFYSSRLKRNITMKIDKSPNKSGDMNYEIYLKATLD